MKNISKLIAAAAFVAAVSPLAHADCHDKDGSGYMKKMDANSDGAVSKEEFTKSKEEWFAKLDADKDGKLNEKEFEAKKDGHSCGGDKEHDAEKKSAS